MKLLRFLVPQTNLRVPHISLVFREIWGATVGGPFKPQEEAGLTGLGSALGASRIPWISAGKFLILEKGGQRPHPTSREKRARYGAPVIGFRVKRHTTKSPALIPTRFPSHSRLLLERHDVYAYLQAVLCPTQKHPTNWADIAIVPPPGQGNMPIRGQTVVGRIEIHPS
jgi:hypothetical protein